MRQQVNTYNFCTESGEVTETRGEDSIEMDLKEIRREVLYWFYLS